MSPPDDAAPDGDNSKSDETPLADFDLEGFDPNEYPLEEPIWRNELNEFPPVEWADEDGLLAIGGEIEPDTLRDAYSRGIFPWPVEGYPPFWFAPPERAVLFLDEFHVARSVKKLLRQRPWEIRVNTAFESVIRACAASPRLDQPGTWITDDIVRAYTALHQSGEAHSVETWLDGELVGGLYGVSWGHYFAGESMFFRESGASKVALCALVAHLRERGATWIDCQMMTPLFASFGARSIERAQFMELLKEAWTNPQKVLWILQRGQPI